MSSIPTAQFEIKDAWLSGSFGRDFALRAFPGLTLQKLDELLGVKSRGSRKGELRGRISWMKCLSGGWVRRGQGEGNGYVERRRGAILACGIYNDAGELVVGDYVILPTDQRSEQGAASNYYKDVVSKYEARRVAKIPTPAVIERKPNTQDDFLRPFVVVHVGLVGTRIKVIDGKISKVESCDANYHFVNALWANAVGIWSKHSLFIA